MTGLSSRIGDPDQGSALSGAIPSALFPARARFRDLIMQRIIALESFRIDFQNGRDPRAALGGVISLAHMIAGVAETLGYPNAGNLAAALELHARDGLERNRPAPEIWHRMEPQLIALMDELESLLDQ